ncbi:MAG: GNAT family N-acetyltransferase [Treponema sp.]|jgi:GNAT superfamily N-acetyltransferase|nr:GNAT family N-acetyltransferase [Treponema sp.]
MKIERITIKDLDKLKHFNPDGWSDIIPKIEYYVKSDYCHPVKMFDENDIFAIGAAILYGNTGWIAHIIVNEKFRSQGYGTKIISYLCEYCKNKNCGTILLFTTDMGYPMYKKYGFITQTEFIRYEKTREIEYKPNANIRNIELNDHEKIYELDKLAVCEDRENILSQYINDGFVYCQNNNILGFYLTSLGEGLIIAVEEEAGLELAKLRISNNKLATLPSENIPGNKYFLENDFKELQRLKKMTYGNEINFNGKYIYNRIGGSFG